MKVASVQMYSGNDLAENLKKADAYISQGAALGADIVLLPEFFNTIDFAHYRDLEMMNLAERDDGPTITAMRESAIRNKAAIIATIYEQEAPGLYFDTAILIDASGEIIFKYRKTHPAAVYSLEKLYFRYGTRFDTTQFKEWCIGINICYDNGFPEASRCVAANGAEIIFAPFTTPRIFMFQEMIRTRAFDNGVFFVAANKVGQYDERILSGGSCIIDPTGKVLAAAPADKQTETVIVAELDYTVIDAARRKYPSWRDRRPDLYTAITREADALM